MLESEEFRTESAPTRITDTPQSKILSDVFKEFVFSLPLSTLIRKTHKRGFSGGIYVF